MVLVHHLHTQTTGEPFSWEGFTRVIVQQMLVRNKADVLRELPNEKRQPV